MSKNSTEASIKLKKEKDRRGAGAIPNQMECNRMIEVGAVLLNRFIVGELIGGGGFAQIFLAKDKEKDIDVAVKIEDPKQCIKRMKLEITVLLTLRGCMGIPEVLGMGNLPNGHYLVMQLVGRNLSDLRRKLPNKCISPKTLYRTVLQIAKSLSLVHGAGFLHRDLKPSNCCIGALDATRIYLIDFGLARQYLDKSGVVRRPRAGVGLRGTIRYMSLDAHARKDLGPNNDLVAFLYTTVELGDGHLPWSYDRDPEKIVQLKKEYVGDKLCVFDPNMTPLAEYIESLSYNSIPDYPKIFTLLENCNPPELKEDDPYDWQQVPEKDNAVSTHTSIHRTAMNVVADVPQTPP